MPTGLESFDRTSDFADFQSMWPFGCSEFFQRFWTQAPCLVRGSPRDLAHLMPWMAINRALSSRTVDDLRIRLVKEGVTVGADAYTRAVRTRTRAGQIRRRVDTVALARHLREGYTMILDEADRLQADLEELLRSFEDELAEKVQANLYCTWRGGQGFRVHWDDHDVYVLQGLIRNSSG